MVLACGTRGEESRTVRFDGVWVRVTSAEEEEEEEDVVDVDVIVLIIVVVLIAVVVIVAVVAAEVMVLAITPLLLPDRAAVSNGPRHSRRTLSAPENEPRKTRLRPETFW